MESTTPEQGSKKPDTKKVIVILSVVVILLIILLLSPARQFLFGKAIGTEICNNQQDDDGDWEVDCADVGCERSEFCLNQPAYRACRQDSQCASGVCEMYSPSSVVGTCTTYEICDRGGDEERDGFNNCADSDCAGERFIRWGDNNARCEYQQEVSCNDRQDNDLDGYEDCADADCDGLQGYDGVCEFGAEVTCNDGFNNDGSLEVPMGLAPGTTYYDADGDWQIAATDYRISEVIRGTSLPNVLMMGEETAGDRRVLLRYDGSSITEVAIPNGWGIGWDYYKDGDTIFFTAITPDGSDADSPLLRYVSGALEEVSMGGPISVHDFLRTSHIPDLLFIGFDHRGVCRDDQNVVCTQGNSETVCGGAWACISVGGHGVFRYDGVSVQRVNLPQDLIPGGYFGGYGVPREDPDVEYLFASQRVDGGSEVYYRDVVLKYNNPGFDVVYEAPRGMDINPLYLEIFGQSNQASNLLKGRYWETAREELLYFDGTSFGSFPVAEGYSMGSIVEGSSLPNLLIIAYQEGVDQSSLLHFDGTTLSLMNENLLLNVTSLEGIAGTSVPDLLLSGYRVDSRTRESPTESRVDGSEIFLRYDGNSITEIAPPINTTYYDAIHTGSREILAGWDIDTNRLHLFDYAGEGVFTSLGTGPIAMGFSTLVSQGVSDLYLGRDYSSGSSMVARKEGGRWITTEVPPYLESSYWEFLVDYVSPTDFMIRGEDIANNQGYVLRYTGSASSTLPADVDLRGTYIDQRTDCGGPNCPACVFDGTVRRSRGGSGGGVARPVDRSVSRPTPAVQCDSEVMELRGSETMSGLRVNLTGAELPRLLRPGSILQGSSVISSTQKLSFVDASWGGVSNQENDDDVLDDYLIISDNSLLGTYALTFTPAFSSDITLAGGGPDLVSDLEDVGLDIMGETYTVAYPLRWAQNDVSLTLVGPHVEGRLGVDASDNYIFESDTYTVEVSAIDTGADAGARFVVNGEATAALQKGEIFILSSGKILSIGDVNYAGTPSVQFYITNEHLFLRDGDITDQLPGTYTLTVNNENIDGADVMIIGSDSGQRISLRRISMKMTMQDDVFIGEGDKLSRLIVQGGDEVDLIFTRNWDIRLNSYDETSGNKTIEIGALCSIVEEAVPASGFVGDTNNDGCVIITELAPTIQAFLDGTVQMRDLARSIDAYLNPAASC